jgi:hypothetical protein
MNAHPHPHTDDDRRRNGGIVLLAFAMLVGLFGSGFVVWRTSQAAFTATTSNAGNNWTAGTVTLTDDDANAAMFSATGLVPGNSGSKCILVTYGGDVSASVKLYSTSVTGTLDPYIDLTIEIGTPGSFSSCPTFSGTSIYSGTLDAFGTSMTTFASGVGTWAPTGAGQTRTYKFSWTLNASTPDAMQGATTSASFQWEARNT